MKGSFLKSLDNRTANLLLRAGFPADGDRELLYDMIANGKWVASFSNVGSQTLDKIGRIAGRRVKLELVSKTTEKLGRHTFTVTKKRLVFDGNGQDPKAPSPGDGADQCRQGYSGP